MTPHDNRFNIRNYDHIDAVPYSRPTSALFNDNVLGWYWGSTPCNSATSVDEDGNPSSLLAIIIAPEYAWAEGDTAPWETWIIFKGREGAKTALRLARWLLRDEPNVPLNLYGSISVIVGPRHAEYACWRRFAEALPAYVEPMPMGDAA